jgi:hypothetical protein
MLSLFFFIQANDTIKTSKIISPFKEYLQQLMGTELLSTKKKQLYPQTPFDNFKYEARILTPELLNTWKSLFENFFSDNFLPSKIFSNQETLDGEISPIDSMATEILNELQKNKPKMLGNINDKSKGTFAELILINPFFSKIKTTNLTPLMIGLFNVIKVTISEDIITSIIANINTFMEKDAFSKYFPFNGNLTNKVTRSFLEAENYTKLSESNLNRIFIEALRYFTCWYLKINNIDKSTQLSEEEKLLRENLEKILIKNIALFYCLFAQELQSTGK